MKIRLRRKPKEAVKVLRPAKTPPKAQKPGKSKPSDRKSWSYLFTRVLLTDKKAKTWEQWKKYWRCDSQNTETVTPFQKELRKAAYERYIQTRQRWAKSCDPENGTGTDFPPNYCPPQSKRGRPFKAKRGKRRNAE